ncbi:MAG: TVP38/TMEM64 family protein, partial [Eggerthella sp.]|nr:TVP38/TMEM64 family protein [Eggerthella sp.]
MAKSAGTQDRELRKRRMAVAAALLAFAGIVGVLALLFGRDALAFLTDGHRVQQQVERLGPLAPVVFGLLVVLQEVTVIVPSEPLELAAG